MSDEHEWIEVMDDMAGGPMVYKSEADEAIATLTAERDAQAAKVRELVEAVLQTNKADILDWQYVYTLAAQLKEQDDE